MKKYILIGLILVFISPNVVYSHPGRLDASGCHTCKTNCELYGLNYYEYHCHSGNSYTNSKGQVFNSNGTLIGGNTSKPNSQQPNNNPTPESPKPYIKSDNTKLKTLTINGEKIDIQDIMHYFTSTIDLNVIAFAEDSKATINIEKTGTFTKGEENQIIITVTSEAGTSKKYTINVVVVSDNPSIETLKINGEKVEIEDTIYFNTTVDRIYVEIKPNDKDAFIDYEENYELEIGENIIEIKSIAQDKKTEKVYTIIVTREKLLSSNKNIELIINDKKIKYNFNNKNASVDVESNTESIDVRFILEDANSQTELKSNYQLKAGDNIIEFKVIAEDNSEEKYTLSIYREKKSNNIIEVIKNISSKIFLLNIFVGVIAFIIYKNK